MKSPFKKVSVVGLGYVGIPTAIAIANRGIPVIGVDINRRIVELINRGQVHIVEPGLDILVQSATKSGLLTATTAPEPADAFIIAVPTPFSDGFKPDITFVEAAARSVAKVVAKGALVILESTSPVGTTEALARWMAEERPDLTFPHQAGENADIQVAYCPERVMPGRALIELVENDRVIGGITRRCAERAVDLYRVFVSGECRLTTSRTAELVKLVENSFRDVNIAFANELSIICEKLDVDVWETIGLANQHPRVNVLRPGPGVGGHCIPVDPWFIVDAAPEEARVIRSARLVNDEMPHRVVSRILDAAKGFDKPRIACLGLAYKADLDDLRMSPAVEIVAELARRSTGQIVAVEPFVEELPRSLADLRNVTFATLDQALESADVVALLVDHRAFRELDIKRLAGRKVVDTLGIWRAATLPRAPSA